MTSPQTAPAERVEPLSFEAANWIDQNPQATPAEKVKAMFGEMLPPQEDTRLERKLEALRKVIDDQKPWAEQKVAFLSLIIEIKLGEMRQPSATTEPVAGIEAMRLATVICREVAELPDRNSPEGWPEAMLVTHDELRGIILAALATHPEPADIDKMSALMPYGVTHTLPPMTIGMGQLRRAVECMADAEHVDFQFSYPARIWTVLPHRRGCIAGTIGTKTRAWFTCQIRQHQQWRLYRMSGKRLKRGRELSPLK
jgi:hypothetical protein